MLQINQHDDDQDDYSEEEYDDNFLVLFCKPVLLVFVVNLLSYLYFLPALHFKLSSLGGELGVTVG